MPVRSEAYGAGLATVARLSVELGQLGTVGKHGGCWDLLYGSSDKENHVLARETMIFDDKSMGFERFFITKTPQNR